MTLLTPEERRIVLFLIASVLIGTGIRVYKWSNPSFAPELKEQSQRQESPLSLPDEEEALMRKVDLNKASQRELESLPGIGPAYAERILAYRREKGPFRRKEDLMKVKGIGKGRYRDLEPHITVGHSGNP